MGIPKQLATELTAAMGKITQDGELPATVRKNAIQLIGKLSTPEHTNAGYLRRTRLALICAREVITYLTPYPDVLAGAKSMWENGVAALSRKYDLTVLQRDNGSFHTRVTDLLDFGETAYVPVYAGMACFSAVNTILFDTNFELVGKNEKNLSPDDWDASYYASLAVSGSAIWEEKGGVENRRSYWHWYLHNAIPMAWDVQTPLWLHS